MTENPFDPKESYEGRLRGKQVPGGTTEAQLTVTPQGVEATPDHGPAHTIPVKGMRLHRDEGGTLVVSEAGGLWSVSCSNPNFLRSLETVAGNHLNDQMARLAGEGVSSRGKHLLGCFIALSFLALLIWSVPRVFKKTITSTVSALPTSIDKSLGEAAQESMDAGGRLIEDEAVLAAMQTIVDRLVPFAQMEGIEYQFRVIENEQSNAYALPGGYITVFTGLIEQSDTPEQVAGVLAHEIAHVSGRHGLQRVAHQVGVIAGVTLLFGNVGGLEAIAVELFTLSQVSDYGQSQETAADLEGLRILIDAEIDPRGLIEFFEKMDAENGGLDLPMFSSHPDFDERIKSIEEALTFSEAPPAWKPIDVDWVAVKEALKK